MVKTIAENIENVGYYEWILTDSLVGSNYQLSLLPSDSYINEDRSEDTFVITSFKIPDIVFDTTTTNPDSSKPLEVETISSRTSIRAYPNPFERYITFDLHTENTDVTRLSFINLSGKLVDQRSTVRLENKITYDGKKLTKGVYIVQIWGAKNIVGHLKIIKTE